VDFFLWVGFPEPEGSLLNGEFWMIFENVHASWIFGHHPRQLGDSEWGVAPEERAMFSAD